MELNIQLRNKSKTSFENNLCQFLDISISAKIIDNVNELMNIEVSTHCENMP